MSTDTPIAKTLALAVKRAMQIHEDSYDHAAADAASAEDEARIAQAKPNDITAHWPYIDYAAFYRKTLAQACDEAAPPGCGRLLYLALQAWWNDAAIWADEILDDGGT